MTNTKMIELDDFQQEALSVLLEAEIESSQEKLDELKARISKGETDASDPELIGLEEWTIRLTELKKKL